MATLIIPQGNINRLLATVLFADVAGLNVSPGNLAKQAISIAWEGDASAYLGTLTGAVPSGEPYQVGRVMIHLVRSQPLAAAFEAQRLSNALVGDITVTPDNTTLPQYDFTNCVIQNVGELAFAGTDPAMVVTLMGTYPINSTLYI